VVTRPLRESIPLSLSLVRSRFERPSRQVQRFVRLIKEHARTSRKTGRARPAA
jgi:hypothetical protein